MIAAYVILALLFLLAVAFALRPFFRTQAQRFPDSPRPEELRAEMEVLAAQAKEAVGEERKQLLAMMVRLERQLAEMGNEKPTPRRLNPVTMAATAFTLVLLGAALWAFTVPRLPGETVITMRDEALQLGNLQRQAERSGAARDWLAFANKAFDLEDLDRAAQGYIQVLELEPRNANAVRRIGMLLFMSGRPEEGAHALELAVRAEPDVSEGWLFLGNSYFQLGRPAEAIVAWEGYLKAGGEARQQVLNLIQTAKGQQNANSKGQQVYLGKCASCHGAQAQGGTGPRLQGNPINRMPEAVRDIILKGRGQMPAMQLTTEEMSALLQYLRGL